MCLSTRSNGNGENKHGSSVEVDNLPTQASKQWGVGFRNVRLAWMNENSFYKSTSIPEFCFTLKLSCLKAIWKDLRTSRSTGVERAFISYSSPTANYESIIHIYFQSYSWNKPNGNLILKLKLHM